MIDPYYKAMTRLSMALKVIPRYYRGHIHILVFIIKVTNCMVSIPICQSRSEEIGAALILHASAGIAYLNT